MHSPDANPLKGLASRVARNNIVGRVHKIIGLQLEVTIANVRLGDLISVDGIDEPVVCEVVGFRDEMVSAIPMGDTRGIKPGARVYHCNGAHELKVGTGLIGRLVDPFGKSLDGQPQPVLSHSVVIDAAPPTIVDRTPVREKFETGVRVIDGLLTCGRGQRVGIFAGAGVGKSVLIEQIARQSCADITVVGLIGERGREVRELLESSKRNQMIVVAATSDRSPMERVRGARSATAIAEHFRDQGANVLLIIDSLTRYAMALREIGLSVGEPPATKGYPPSVFATLPRLLERVAPTNKGSITAFYTVLVEGDDLSDPVADSARSLLDAHIVLSRELAARNHFPAVDVLASASRVARQVTSAETQTLASTARELLDQRRLIVELQNLGAYTPGTNAQYDRTLELGKRLDNWSKQDADSPESYESTMAQLAQSLDKAAKP